MGKLRFQMACINNVTVKPNPRAKAKKQKKKQTNENISFVSCNIHDDRLAFILTLIWSRDISAIPNSMLSLGVTWGT